MNHRDRVALRPMLGLGTVAFFILAFTAGNRAYCAEIASASANDFLNSLGINTHIDQGVSGGSYIEPLRFLGIRNIRDGGRNSLQTRLVSRETGVRLDLICGGDLEAAITTGKNLASAGALMAFEGPNEPNNFPITYNGEKGGGSESWAPVARFQAALYAAVKSDPQLRQFPVFAVSEGGAETDNVGLQFLEIPAGAQTTFPPGTKYADFANPHNYVSSTRSIYVNNQAWNAADPVLRGPWDGLSVEYGLTWRHGYKGYENDQLAALPRVTTETGWDSVDGFGGERTQGTVLVNTYLAQFKRGWHYTFIYQLRDGEGSPGNQGVFNANSSPKLAARYIHNLTTILADKAPVSLPNSLSYSIADQPATVHDLLLQKSTGAFELVIWDENAGGNSDQIRVGLGRNFKTVNIYDVTTGTKPIVVLNDVASVPLTLNDHALIVELTN